MRTTWRTEETVSLLITLKDNKVLLVLPYSTPNAALTDETKGKVTVTFQKASDESIMNDADGTPCDHLPAFANGTVYSQATCKVPPGFAEACELIYTVWYHKTVSGVLSTRALLVGSITIEEGIQASAPG